MSLISTDIKLPRKVEESIHFEKIKAILNSNLFPLWEKSSHSVPRVTFSPKTQNALEKAHFFKKIEKGLESIEKSLKAEKIGLLASQGKQNIPVVKRISRLLIITTDGADRFYRSCDGILEEHADRLLTIQLDTTSDKLGALLYGPGKVVKALLVLDKDAVAMILQSLVC